MLSGESQKFALDQLFEKCGKLVLESNFVCIAERSGIILYTNDFFKEFLGILDDSMLGKNINEFHSINNSETFLDSINKDLESNQKWRGECTCKLQSRTYYIYSFFYLIHDREDNRDLIIALSFDITEQKQKAFNEERYNRVIREQYNIMTEDLQLAAKTQKVFMMPSYVETRNLTIHTFMKPFIHVTGDVLSHKLNSDGSVDILLADVAGHGMSSAYFTSSLVFIFQNLIPESTSDPAKILHSIYNKIRYISNEIFICGTLLRINPDYTIEYSYAGTLPMFIIRKSNWTVLDGKGTPMTNGLDLVFTNFQEKVTPGDRILLFSDGCYELTTDDNKILGYSGFLDYLRMGYSGEESNPAETVIHKLFAVSNNKFNDDVSFALIQII